MAASAPARATQKQIDLMLELAVRAGVHTEDQVKLIREQVRAKGGVSRRYVRAKIDLFNEQLGFAKTTTRATDAQMAYVWKLEKLVHGEEVELSMHLTWESADLRIKTLKVEREMQIRETVTNVIDIKTRRSAV